MKSHKVPIMEYGKILVSELLIIRPKKLARV
jgi:hypothetical protein